jgi:hypothetical protein
MEEDHTVAEFTAGMQNLIGKHSWLDATIKIVLKTKASSTSTASQCRTLSRMKTARLK